MVLKMTAKHFKIVLRLFLPILAVISTGMKVRVPSIYAKTDVISKTRHERNGLDMLPSRQIKPDVTIISLVAGYILIHASIICINMSASTGFYFKKALLQ